MDDGESVIGLGGAEAHGLSMAWWCDRRWIAVWRMEIMRQFEHSTIYPQTILLQTQSRLNSVG